MFDKSQMSESFDVPAGCYTAIFERIERERGLKLELHRFRIGIEHKHTYETNTQVIPKLAMATFSVHCALWLALKMRVRYGISIVLLGIG